MMLGTLNWLNFWLEAILETLRFIRDFPSSGRHDSHETDELVILADIFLILSTNSDIRKPITHIILPKYSREKWASLVDNWDFWTSTVL